MAQIVEARGCVLFTTNPNWNIMRWTASAGLQEAFGTFISEGWFMRDPRLARFRAARHAGFLADADLVPAEELARDEGFWGFRRPRGLGGGAGTALPLPTGDSIGFGVERDVARGPVEPAYVHLLDELRPHLARSALMSARLQLERARAAAETLALIGLPALVFNNGGKVIAANSLIEELTDRIRWLARDRVSLTDAGADAIFRQAIATLDVNETAPPRSFAVRGVDASPVMVAHVIPVRGAARDVFAFCAGLLVLTPVTLPDAPPVELIQSLFDLTPAEARVARNLTAGDSLEDIAAASGLSRNTVRSQLRGALEKTGSRRQAELVALLGGIAPRRK